MSLYCNMEINHMNSCLDHKIRIFLLHYVHQVKGMHFMNITIIYPVLLDEKHFMGFVVCLVMASQRENTNFIMPHFKSHSNETVF